MTLVNSPLSHAPAPSPSGAAAVPAFGIGTIPNLAAGQAVPLYEKAKRHMSEAILIGEWPPGMVLPSETVLAQMFGVAIGTMRRALTDLVAEGLLSRRRKTGTVVTGRSPHHSLRLFFQYFRLHRADGSLTHSQAQVLGIGRHGADARESRVLQIAPGAAVVRLHRLRHADGAPVMRDLLTLPLARVPDLPMVAEEVPALLYVHLLEEYGIRISAIRETLTAICADATDAALLALPKGAPLLMIEDIAFDQAGVPVVMGCHRASTARHAYVNEIR